MAGGHFKSYFLFFCTKMSCNSDTICSTTTKLGILKFSHYPDNSNYTPITEHLESISCLSVSSVFISVMKVFLPSHYTKLTL